MKLIATILLAWPLLTSCMTVNEDAIVNNFWFEFSEFRYSLYADFAPVSEDDSFDSIMEKFRPVAAKLAAWLEDHSDGLRAWQDRELGLYQEWAWDDTIWQADDEMLNAFRLTLAESQRRLPPDYVEAVSWQPIGVINSFVVAFSSRYENSIGIMARTYKNFIAGPYITTRKLSGNRWEIRWIDEKTAYAFVFNQNTNTYELINVWTKNLVTP